MSRPLALYGVASATLVGAFFLLPKANDAPPPLPPPVVSSTSPVTHLLYSDGVIHVEGRLDRGYLAESGPTLGEPLYLDMTIRAADLAARAPVTAVLVIDRSGSMAGDAIENARFAADRLIRRLVDGDRVAVVSYATDVTVDFPLTVVDPTSRTAAIRAVARIEEGGGTNIEGGLAAATRVIEDATWGAHAGVTRLLFISDGRPTEGSRRQDTLTRFSQNLRAKGVTTSAIGVGLDYNEDLLTRIAVDGGGRYHYLRESRLLSKILDDELTHAAAVVARNVTLKMPTNLGALRIEDVPGQLATIAQQTVVTVGDLAAGEERHVLFVIRTPTAVSDNTSIQWNAPIVNYLPMNNAETTLAARGDAFRVAFTTESAQINQSRRGDVNARVLQVNAATLLEETMELYKKGDVKVAQEKLQSNLDVMRAANKNYSDDKLADEAANIERVLKATAAAPAGADTGAALIKEQKARAFGLRR